MAENMNAVIAVETNTDALKEALCVQQRLLQKLYNELDVEREATATAASEALSMILRLQGEKAAVKMEAEQYKRLAEEKMNYAEESMEIFEEVMYQKEMEIAYLDYQVRAYRNKLLSLGYDDLGVKEIKFPENLLQKNETLVIEPSPVNTLKRIPTPPISKRLKLPNLKKGTPERDRSVSPDSDMLESSLEDGSHNTRDLEKKEGSSSGDINVYLEQIQKLDRIVEEVAGERYPRLRGRSARSSSVPCNLNEWNNMSESPPKSAGDKKSSEACSSSSGHEHDVFEVPLANESYVSSEKHAKKSHAKNGTHSGRKALPPKCKDKKAHLPRDGSSVSFHLVNVQPTKGSGPESTSQQRNTSSDITESQGVDEAQAEGQNTREEPVSSRGGLALLYEIREKLNLIESDIRRENMKTNKYSPNYDLPMLQLSEAMLHFWL